MVFKPMRNIARKVKQYPEKENLARYSLIILPISDLGR